MRRAVGVPAALKPADSGVRALKGEDQRDEIRERLRGYGARAARLLARQATAPYRLVKSLSIKPPTRLWIAPPDIRTADSTVADEMRAGYFSFEGKTVHVVGDDTPFRRFAPSVGWRRTLTGFSWLRHLGEADRLTARRLVDAFISTSPARDDPAQEPAIVARRLLSFLAQSPLLLDEADSEFYERFMLALAQHARLLWLALSAGATRGSERALCAIALVEFSVCADSGHAIAPEARRLLSAELKRQILADGGHVSRNPQAPLDLLLDLLALRQVFAARGLKTPETMKRAISRALPMLRMMQHGDGALALFNGAGATARDRLANVLAHEETRGAAPLQAPETGYQRLEAGEALALIDAGGAPPAEFAGAAHAGCLSFEYSRGIERIVVNCGAPGPHNPEARDAARTTAAHSTLTIGESSSARFIEPAYGAGDRPIEGPDKVTVERRALENETTLLLSHNGYAAAYGLAHARELTLSHDGAILSGRDRLLTATNSATKTPAEFALRFHLHPQVKATPATDGIELTLGDGARLLFSATGAEPRIGDSIFYAHPAGARACRQIVLTGVATPGVDIHWSFRPASAPGAVPPDRNL
jgi:uncharacterized heparinase superfamily protein